MKHFDPFDPNNRDRRKRRSKAQIAADEAAHKEPMDRAFMDVLDSMDWPDYVQGNLLLEDASLHHDNYYCLRRNVNEILERLGYSFWPNPGSKDRRWKAFGKTFSVYKRHGAEPVSRNKLKFILEW
jgi:hypothetical protein